MLNAPNRRQHSWHSHSMDSGLRRNDTVAVAASEQSIAENREAARKRGESGRPLALAAYLM